MSSPSTVLFAGAVRTRPAMFVKNCKVTRTQKRELRPRPSLGRNDLVEVLTLYDVTVLVSHGFVTAS